MLIALALLPVVELLVIVALHDVLGAWTVPLLALAAVLGFVIMVRGGRTTFRRVREVLRAGRVPSKELAEAFLTLLGGVLLVVPGFVSDVLALVCLVPPLRWGARAALLAVLGRTVGGAVLRATPPGGGRVVEGHVLPSPDRDAEPPTTA